MTKPYHWIIASTLVPFVLGFLITLFLCDIASVYITHVNAEFTEKSQAEKTAIHLLNDLPKKEIPPPTISPFLTIIDQGKFYWALLVGILWAFVGFLTFHIVLYLNKKARSEEHTSELQSH